MCADDGGVDHDTFIIHSDAKRLEDRRPVAAQRPVGEAIVDGLPRAEAFGQVAPRNACFCAKQYGVDKSPVVELRWWATSLGHGDTHHRPLSIGQSMAERHAQL